MERKAKLSPMGKTCPRIIGHTQREHIYHSDRSAAQCSFTMYGTIVNERKLNINIKRDHCEVRQRSSIILIMIVRVSRGWLII